MIGVDSSSEFLRSHCRLVAPPVTTLAGADDIAGISDIYGNATFVRQTGSISGTVTKNGQGVLGAHIVAFNPASGKLVGGFSLSADGSFVIAGLLPKPSTR